MNKFVSAILIFILILFNKQVAFSQNKIIDSLINVIKVSADDTNKVKTLNNLHQEYLNIQNEKRALQSLYEAIALSQKIGFKKGLAKSYFNIAYIHIDHQEYYQAIELCLKSLDIYREIKYDKGTLNCLSIIGYIHRINKSPEKSLEYQNEALKLAKKIKDNYSIQWSYGEIIMIYTNNLVNYDQAIKYSKELLKHNESNKDTTLIIKSIWSLGGVYRSANKLDLAIECQKKAIELSRAIRDKDLESHSLVNIAHTYLELKNHQEALNCFLASYEIDKNSDDKSGLSLVQFNISNTYLKLKDYSNALKFAFESKESASQMDRWLLNEINLLISDIYKESKDYSKAFAYLSKYVAFEDSANTVEKEKDNAKKVSEIQNQYEFQQIEKNNLLEEQKKEIIRSSEKKQQILIIAFLIILALVTGLFLVFLYKRFSITKTQKHIIEEKQQEIIESITYAKRLQEAILPPQEFLNKYIPDNFILYKPKDLVAGDFYWAEQIGDKFFIAAADSTGHGVPGCMVSVVCSNALNRTVKEFDLTNTGKILDKTRELVLETFAKSTTDVKDGMDISLLCIDSRNKQLFWSGANNPLWYISPLEGGGHRPGDVDTSTTLSVTEIKADKQPIGKSDHAKPFTTHQIEYKENTTFYLFTDGFADQFGGPNGKKFKYKQLKDLLLEIHHNPMNEQLNALQTSFANWKGDLEQVDDVCVIGVKL